MTDLHSHITASDDMFSRTQVVDISAKNQLDLKKYVFTGGGCAGKTSTLRELGDRGYYIVQEANRIAMRNGIPKTEINKLRLYLESTVPRGVSVAFCERGVVDSIAFLRLQGKSVPQEAYDICKRNRYDGVFLFEMLPEYVKDTYRIRSRAEAEREHDLIRQAYVEQGYSPILVPVMPTNERADFVERSVSKHPEVRT